MNFIGKGLEALRLRALSSLDDLIEPSSGEKAVSRVSGVPSCLHESAPPLEERGEDRWKAASLVCAIVCCFDSLLDAKMDYVLRTTVAMTRGRKRESSSTGPDQNTETKMVSNGRGQESGRGRRWECASVSVREKEVETEDGPNMIMIEENGKPCCSSVVYSKFLSALF